MTKIPHNALAMVVSYQLYGEFVAALATLSLEDRGKFPASLVASPKLAGMEVAFPTTSEALNNLLPAWGDHVQ